MISVAPHTLLYLSRVGSHLFGTSTPNSDLDVKGLFLPSRESLLLQEAPQHFSANTNDPGSGSRNTAADMDVTILSVQFWMRLLEKGDMNAVTVLFSWTNPEAVLTAQGAGRSHGGLADLPEDEVQAEFMERLRELDTRRLLTRTLSGMTGFVYNQAFKYSRKGAQFQAVERTRAIMLEVLAAHENATVGDASPLVLHEHAASANAAFGPQETVPLVRLERARGGAEQLVVVNRAFDLGAALSWALPALEKLHATFGDRARAAAEGGGVDHKSVSHSLRVIEEIKALHRTGRVTYPLPRAAWLRDIKLGRYGVEVLGRWLEEEFEAARALEAASVLAETFDRRYAADFITGLYG